MKVCLITNIDTDHSYSKIQSLYRSFECRGVSCDVIINDGTLVEITTDGIKTRLPLYDYVIYLDKDIYTAKMLEKLGYKLINNSDFIELCDNKLYTLIECADIVKCVPSSASPLVYHELREENDIFLDKVEKDYGYPLIMKKTYGSLGEGVFLVKNRAELDSLYEKHCKEPLLFEPYIEGGNESIRVLVLDHKILGAISRISIEDEYRSNFGKTSSAPYRLGKKLEKIVSKLIDKFDIIYAGLDFLKVGNDYFLLEINSNAFYDEFSRVKKIDVAHLFADMVISKGAN
ncbi:MAG: ATP-grasp domain-containing protein [Coprobacillus sp.]|nr:ATP-grasp domain-containing protein [Coprobacillus sp.]